MSKWNVMKWRIQEYDTSVEYYEVEEEVAV
jgi:hypothetical protein